MSKLINGIVATATSAVLTIAGVNFAHNEKPEETNRDYCVIRSDVPPNVQSAVDWSVMIANDDSYGYDPDRTRKHDLDCSELIIEAYKQAGFNVGEATYTGNMKRVFEANGFEVLDYYAGMPLQIGDVFLNETYHTEMLVGYYDNGIGKNVGAHDDFNGVSGDSDVDYDGVGDEIDFGEYTEYTSVHPWEYILRYKAHFYDWLQIPDYENDFYAFIESDNTVLASYNDVLFMEKQTDAPSEVWHFVKEDNNRFAISNGSYSGSYNLYKDDTGAIILHEVGSESSCLTSVAGTVINTEYDSCSEEQRFRIRPVSDILVTYDFGGKECPIRKEHYNSAYSSAFDLVITGFKGWSTTPNGEIIDTSRVLIPYDHTLYAIIDESIKPTVEEETASGHSAGNGRHDSGERTDAQSTTNEVAIAEEIDTHRDDIYNPALVTEPAVQETRTAEPVIERTPINVQSITLNRTNKMLNTGNSKSFTLMPIIFPTNADNTSVSWSSSDASVASVDSYGNIIAHKEGSCKIFCTANGGNASASCNVTVKNEVNKTYGEWSDWSANPIVSSSGLEVQTKQTYKKIPERYKMIYYCTKDLNGNRVYSDTSINGQYDLYQRSSVYGEWSYMQQLGNQNYWIYYASELGEEIPRNSWLSGSQAGINKGSRSGYAVSWGNDTILAYIDEVYYKEETTTLYRYRNVTNTPVEYS